MKNYETLILFSEDTSEADQKKLVDQTKDLIEKNKGQVSNIENWGKKTLAFQIGPRKSGFYWLLSFAGQDNQPKKVNDFLRIEDSVLRFLTTGTLAASLIKKSKPTKKVETKKKLAETFIR